MSPKKKPAKKARRAKGAQPGDIPQFFRMNVEVDDLEVAAEI